MYVKVQQTPTRFQFVSKVRPFLRTSAKKFRDLNKFLIFYKFLKSDFGWTTCKLRGQSVWLQCDVSTVSRLWHSHKQCVEIVEVASLINLLYRKFAIVWFKNLEISSSEPSYDSYVDFEFSDFELEVKGAIYEYQDEQDNSVGTRSLILRKFALYS